jgi:hypothetical protein
MDELDRRKLELMPKLVEALAEANAHIREQLQPELENLADGIEVTIPEGFTREQALMRLATWWHGVGTDDLIAQGRALLEPAAASTEDEAEARVSATVGTYMTQQGVRSWWNRPRHQLDGKTPRQVWASDPEQVRDLAEAGRSQG